MTALLELPGTPADVLDAPAQRWFQLFIMVLHGPMPGQPGKVKVQIIPFRKKVPMWVAWKWVGANNLGRIRNIVCLAREVDEDGEQIGDACLEPGGKRFCVIETHEPFIDQAVETDIPIGATKYDAYVDMEGGAESECARRDGDTHLEYIARELRLGGPVEGGQVLHDTGIIEPGWIADEAA